MQSFQFTDDVYQIPPLLPYQGMRSIQLLLGIILMLFPSSVFAQVVISEVMWPGSDLSTSDEWLEIANSSYQSVDLSGWTITYLKSTGAEGVDATFNAGTIINPGQYLIVGSKHEGDSRLAREPDVYASGLSLPNTKLSLKLKNASGTIIDQVDDGIGIPFAGANPSGTGAKASMERIDLLASGSLETNWRTATTSEGFDAASHVFGTPGFINGTNASVQSSESASSLAPEVIAPIPEVMSLAQTGTPAPCTDPLAIQISVQSGEFKGTDHTTVNFEAIAASGSLTGLTCQWSFSDGFSSTSCNPSAHAFTNPGITIVNLAVVNHCGNTLVQTLNVEVIPSVASSSAGSSLPAVPYDGSRVIIAGVMPNPPGADTGKEWVELKNVEDHQVSLVGYALVLGEATKQHFKLGGSVDSRGTLRIWNSETKFRLRNTTDTLRLIAPNGDVLSTVTWETPEEDRVYLPSEIRSITVRGTVASVVDGDTFDLSVDPDAARALGTDVIRVRLLGVDTPEVFTDTGAPEPFSQEASEFTRALIENKRVELEFDTELWDKYGRLLAYVFMDGGVLLQDQLLVNGLARATYAFQYRRKDLFLQLETKAKDSRIGLWSIDQDPALTGAKNVVVGLSNSDIRPGLFISDSSIDRTVSISEIFPAPDAHALRSELAVEWIELGREGTEPMSLSGWMLTIGKRSKKLDHRIHWGSGRYLLLRTGDVKLQLPNDGGAVTLRSPDGSILLDAQYPKLKTGQSYSWDAPSRSFCVSAPTPLMENRCLISSTISKRVSTAGRRTIAYAASYREQLRDSPDTVIDISSTSSSDAVSASWLLFMTLPGAAVGVLGTVLGLRLKWIRIG